MQLFLFAECSIWNHLVRLSTDYGRTVIITTHYIEEARQADTVRRLVTLENLSNFTFFPFFYQQIGLMRSGHLLAEESPRNLLTLHGLGTLEEVFLKLSSNERAKKHGALTASGRTVRSVDSTQQEEQGQDNPAFIYTPGNPDATTRASTVS